MVEVECGERGREVVKCFIKIVWHMKANKERRQMIKPLIISYVLISTDL